MREIRFRQFIDSKFYYWGFINNKNEEFRSPVTTSASGISINKAQEISEQYTGLKDVSGKEIYEGDILECWDDNTKCIREVWEYSPFRSYQWIASWESKKIIGNIHENPELLNRDD